MKRITIAESPIDIHALLELAQESPVLLITPEGKEFLVTLADDFSEEVAQLRESAAFQAFLDARGSQQRPRRSLVEVAREIDAEVVAEVSLGEGEKLV